jgi:hypothetical protein
MQNEKKKISKKIYPTSDYYKEIIVEPAEKLLKALIEADIKEKEVTPKARKAVCKTAIHR